MSRSVTILGAGLVGSLLSIILRKKGYPVEIFERRPDMRRAELSAGRSINLAMSERGWRALNLAGLREEMNSLAIPMYGRFLHQANGESAFQQYGKNKEAIYSVSRGELNKKLMDLAEAQGVTINFDQRCTKVNVSDNTLYLQNEKGEKSTRPADLLFGADGAFSALRTSYTFTDRVNASQMYIEHGYKELHIPPGAQGEFQMEKNALHIWPRHNFMLIALPNTDGSFTCTLFFPFKGAESFDTIRTDAEVMQLFKKHFPDVIPLMPTLLEDFKNNPVSSLITTHIFPWHMQDKSALIGDAAHAIVPFYGQGMNAGFEDCTVLNELIEHHGGDWSKILSDYEDRRKENGDAVTELALHNFIEMRDKVADPQFLQRKKIEQDLGKRFPEQFVSVYEMVSFTHIPYKHALNCTKAQDVLLQKIMKEDPDYFKWIEKTSSQTQLEKWMTDYAKEVSQN